MPGIPIQMTCDLWCHEDIMYRPNKNVDVPLSPIAVSLSVAPNSTVTFITNLKYCFSYFNSRMTDVFKNISIFNDDIEFLIKRYQFGIVTFIIPP